MVFCEIFCWHDLIVGFIQLTPPIENVSLQSPVESNVFVPASVLKDSKSSLIVQTSKSFSMKTK